MEAIIVIERWRRKDVIEALGIRLKLLSGDTPWIYFQSNLRIDLMTTDAQRKAVDSFRRRSRKAGLVRFEVSAPDRDKALVREVAKQLAQRGPLAEGVRAKLRKIVASSEPRPTGGIWRALRRSPLVGADLDTPRAPGGGRKVAL